MNILQVQDQLKGLSQDQLVREMQMPSGAAPQYLVLSELTRRKKMQADLAAQKAKGPQMTVAQEAVAAAGVPQAGLPGIAQAMAPKTDVTNNTGAMPMPAPMPSEAPVGMADGGRIGNSFRAMLETDPAMVVMANRMGMTVREYLDTLPDEAINANAARVIKAQEQSALGVPRTDVFDPNRPAYAQTTSMELDETFKQLRDNIRDQEVMAMGVNPSFAYDTAMQKYGIGISDRRMPAPSLDALDLTLPGGDPIIRHITSAGANYLAPDLGVPAAGDLPPDLYQPTRTWGQRNIGDPLRALLQPVGEAAREVGQPIGAAAREIGQPIGDAISAAFADDPLSAFGGIGPKISTPADILLAASAGPMAPMAPMPLPFQGAPVANQSEAMPPKPQSWLDDFASTGAVPSGATTRGLETLHTPSEAELRGLAVREATVNALGDAASWVGDTVGGAARTIMDPINALVGSGVSLVSPEIGGQMLLDVEKGREARAAATIDALTRKSADDAAALRASLGITESLKTPEEVAAAAEAAKDALADTETPDTPTTPTTPITPPGSPSGGGTRTSGGAGSGSSGAGGMSSFEQEIMDAIGRSEKRAEQDKWLALAQAGMEIMNAAGRQGTFAGAVGEGGAKGLAAFREGRDNAENTRLNLLKQLEDSRLARATLAARSAGSSSASRVPSQIIDYLGENLFAVEAELNRLRPRDEGWLWTSDPDRAAREELLQKRNQLQAQINAALGSYGLGISGQGADPFRPNLSD